MSININHYNASFNGYTLPGQVYVMLNGTVYNYGQSYRIMGGNYSASYTGIAYLYPPRIFFDHNNYIYGVTTLQIVTPQGSQTYNFTDMPSYLYTNSQMTVCAYCGTTYYWYPL